MKTPELTLETILAQYSSEDIARYLMNRNDIALAFWTQEFISDYAYSIDEELSKSEIEQVLNYIEESDFDEWNTIVYGAIDHIKSSK